VLIITCILKWLSHFPKKKEVYIVNEIFVQKAYHIYFLWQKKDIVSKGLSKTSNHNFQQQKNAKKRKKVEVVKLTK
jgi:hypothetical protein